MKLPADEKSSALAFAIVWHSTLIRLEKVLMKFSVDAAVQSLQGVMHRDVKPENVLLDGKGSALLTDFGLALDTTEQVPGARVGTIDYLAPEASSSIWIDITFI